MTPTDWYRARAAHWGGERDRASATSTTLSRLRLAAFGAGVALVWWGLSARGAEMQTPAVAAGFACFIVFTALVVRHARVLDRLERAETGVRLAEQGRQRIARDWHALPEVAAPAALDWDAHPYARDLDLFGHASLTKWLGATATPDGSQQLLGWILEGAAPDVIRERQAAVDELAAQREWRETLAIEGRLTTVSDTDLNRFIEWLESPDSAVPRFMPAAAIGLPVTLAVLMLLFVLGLTEGAWWLVPLTINVALSFVLAPRMYAAFERATMGKRVLRRYASMLAHVSGAGWSGGLLQRLRGAMEEGGSAPRLVNKFAGLAEWSELRIGAALLHFPVQALTLWDFHILLALERWRRRHGAHVRPWLRALGGVDALAVLAVARADEPDWGMPVVDAGADRIEAVALGHPLIPADHRVANDVSVGPAGTVLLVTGSNMSGKSTLLRAIGLNAVLAQAGAPACARTLRMPPADLHTSIRVQDSLELGLSYFMAALARLKQIVDAAERGARPGRRLAYLLDEVLQGTNSAERSIAVRAVAKHLLDAGAIGAMTTHDLALANEDPLKSAAALVHFTEHVDAAGRMTFDYRLRPGIATSTNALRLMQLIGIQPR